MSHLINYTSFPIGLYIQLGRSLPLTSEETNHQKNLEIKGIIHLAVDVTMSVDVLHSKYPESQRVRAKLDHLYRPHGLTADMTDKYLN